MKNILDTVFLDNTLRLYIIVIGTILLAFVFKRMLSRFLAGWLFRVVGFVARGVDKPSFVSLVVTPLQTFLVILVTILALDKLKFPSLLNFRIYKASTQQVFETVSIIVLILAFIWLLLRIVDFIALILHKKTDVTADPADNQLIVFFGDFFKVMFVIVGLLLILKFAFSYNITSLLTALSIGGAAIALATRESLENLIASFIIFFDKPFTVGDLVRVQQITGTIEKIGLRSTRLRTVEKTYVSVPNKQMVDSIVDNLSLRTQRKADIRLDVGLSTGTARMQELISNLQMELAHPRIEKMVIFFNEITSQAYVILGEYYTAPIAMDEFNLLKQEINLRIIRLLERMQIEMAGANTEVRLRAEDISHLMRSDNV